MVQRDSILAEYEALHHYWPLLTSSKIVRFQPFRENNLIRLGGTLQFADLSHTEKRPFLLDGSHHITHLLIRHTHIQLHHLGIRVLLSYLRYEFSILRARQKIKNILRTYLPCKIDSNAREQEVEAPLPSERLQPSTPFAVTGLGFAGPLFTKKDQAGNSYIVLLICASTTALLFELSSDITVDKFLMALDRFVSRRGLPHKATMSKNKYVNLQLKFCTLLPTFVCLNTWSLFLDISLCALLISRVRTFSLLLSPQTQVFSLRYTQ